MPLKFLDYELQFNQTKCFCSKKIILALSQHCSECIKSQVSECNECISHATWNVHIWVMTTPHDRLDSCKPFLFSGVAADSRFWCTSEIPPASWRLIRIGSGGGPPSLKVNRVGSKAGLLVTVPLWIFSTQLISRKNAPSYRLPHNTECQRQCCLRFC